MHLQVAQIVTFIVAGALALSRLLNASKPFWNLFPAWLAGIFPGLVIAVPALGQAIVGAQSWTDLAVAFMAAGALLLPGAHSHSVGSDVKPPSAGASKPVLDPYIPARSQVGFPPDDAACVDLFARVKRATLSGAFLACLLSGCLQSKFTWPDAVSCAPTPATLGTQVEAILMAGGDYVGSLEHLALSDGKAAVICAVSGFLNGISMLNESDRSAKERARTFLAQAGTKVSK